MPSSVAPVTHAAYRNARALASRHVPWSRVCVHNRTCRKLRSVCYTTLLFLGNGGGKKCEARGLANGLGECQHRNVPSRSNKNTGPEWIRLELDKQKQGRQNFNCKNWIMPVRAVGFRVAELSKKKLNRESRLGIWVGRQIAHVAYSTSRIV